jgi:hypothetical protein
MQFYELKLSNVGGIPMPVILEFTFKDNSTEIVHIPAEIWRKYESEISKVFFFDKKVSSILVDPFLETADTDINNNSWPEKQAPTKFELFRSGRSSENPMQRDLRLKEISKKNEGL